VRIVVFSDSHGDFRPLVAAVEAQPKAHAFFHLGDCEQELDDLRTLYPDKLIHFVKGNCDFGSLAKDQEIIILGGRRFFLTHGHLYGVKNGLKKITEAGQKLDADVICFGHTHSPHTGLKNGVYLLNPGTAGDSRGAGTSYGLIDIRPAGIEMTIVPL